MPPDLNEIVAANYEDMRRYAHKLMAGDGNKHTLSPTAVVHEAVLRFIEKQSFNHAASDAQRRAIAMNVVLQVLSDYFRRKKTLAEGGRMQRHPWDEGVEAITGRLDESLGGLHARLDDAERARAQDALSKFSVEYPDLYDTFWCVTIKGLTQQEAAQRLGITDRAVRNRQNRAVALLRKRLEGVF